MKTKLYLRPQIIKAIVEYEKKVNGVKVLVKGIEVSMAEECSVDRRDLKGVKDEDMVAVCDILVGDANDGTAENFYYQVYPLNTLIKLGYLKGEK